MARAVVLGRQRFVEWIGLGVFGFEPDRSQVTCWPVPGASPDNLHDIFFRQLQPLILQASGWQALHASAVHDERGVVLFCGRARSGKSTLAFGLTQRRFRQFADDQVVWRPTSNGPEAIALRFTPRLRPASRQHFGQVSPTRPEIDSDVSRRLIAVILLRQDAAPDDAIHVERVASRRAFPRLLHYAHCFDPTDRSETARLVTDYTSLATAVPVFSVRYKPGFDMFDALMDAINELLTPSALADAMSMR